MPWKEHKIENAITITNMYSLFEYHFENDWNFEGESHDFWECVYVINGSIRVSGDGRVYTLTSGEMIFHKPMEFHKLSLLGLDCADVLIFTYSAIGELVTYFNEKVFLLSESQQSVVNNLIEYMRNMHKNINTDQLEKEFRYLWPQKDNKIYLQTVVSYIQILLLSLSDSGKTASYEQNPDAIIFHKAVSFMKENLEGQTNAEEIAKVSNTSLSTLKRVFNKFVGLPIYKYYLTLKIQYATELLQKGYSVCDTADILKFSSQAHFSKIYKSITGKNPSEMK